VAIQFSRFRFADESAELEEATPFQIIGLMKITECLFVLSGR
jgi:hypothetical protein